MKLLSLTLLPHPALGFCRVAQTALRTSRVCEVTLNHLRTLVVSPAIVVPSGGSVQAAIERGPVGAP